MTDKEIVTRIRDLVAEEDNSKKPLKMVGVLNKTQGIVGYKRAEIGTPVLQKADRWIIIMESIDGKASVEIPYYPEALAPVVDMEGTPPLTL